jgi:hypothetical protein
LSDAPIADWPTWLLELARKKSTLAAACKSSDGIVSLTHAAVSVKADAEIGVSVKGNRTINLKARCKVILRQVEYAKPGERKQLLHWAACRLGEIIAEGRINPDIASLLLEGAAKTNGLWHDDGPQQCQSTIKSGIGAGIRDFRDRMGTNVVQFKQKETE